MNSDTPPARASFLIAAVRHIGIVLLVAAAVATVFTMWSPVSLLPSGAARAISIALATQVGVVTTPEPPTA
nr:hypothetical protein [Chloroflexota bacterium]